MKGIVDHKSLAYYSSEYSYSEGSNEMEMDQESNGSSTEDVESPRSVAVEKLKRRQNRVSRIKAEDSHVGEDIGEGHLLCLKDKNGGTVHFMLYSRPILPASPLGGKTSH